MADVLAWADKLPDIIKKWILIIPMILAAVGSGTGIYQYIDKKDVIESKNKDIRDVATEFQKMIPEPKKQVIVRDSGCDYCKSEIKKLKRWHE